MAESTGNIGQFIYFLLEITTDVMKKAFLSAAA
jgi:hypothetical protein